MKVRRGRAVHHLTESCEGDQVPSMIPIHDLRTRWVPGLCVPKTDAPNTEERNQNETIDRRIRCSGFANLPAGSLARERAEPAAADGLLHPRVSVQETART